MPATERLIYRTKDNQADYRFEFVTHSDGTERAYILAQPSYRNRDPGPHPTHRYFDSDRNQHYICFDPPPESRDLMTKISAQWAENTQLYIRYGTSF